MARQGYLASLGTLGGQKLRRRLSVGQIADNYRRAGAFLRNCCATAVSRLGKGAGEGGRVKLRRKEVAPVFSGGSLSDDAPFSAGGPARRL